MKRALLVSILVLGTIAIGIGLFISQRTTNRENLTVQTIDGKGIFVGDKRLAPTSRQDSAIHPRLLQEQKEHKASLRAIDEAAKYIREGDRQVKDGYMQGAATAYEKAYSIGGGSSAVSGLLLATTHEKLGRYDDGIVLLDEMIQKGYLSETGVQNANEIRSRLIEAKNK